MPRTSPSGSTLQQVMYARRVWAGGGKNKKEVAKAVGYSENVSNNVLAKIERSRGYQNAIVELAKESNEIALGIMQEFKRRGFDEFSNKDLTGALNAIANAWSKFNAEPKKDDSKLQANKLRAIVIHEAEKSSYDVKENPNVPPAPVHTQGAKPNLEDF